METATEFHNYFYRMSYSSSKQLHSQNPEFRSFASAVCAVQARPNAINNRTRPPAVDYGPMAVLARWHNKNGINLQEFTV